MKKEITVVGLGYIGLPTAIVLASAGHNVKGFDTSLDATRQLQRGKIHIVENDLQEAFDQVFNKTLKIYSELPVSDVYILCVPTPFLEDQEEKRADLTYVQSAALMVAQVLKKGDLVILESTVPPYTTQMVSQILAKKSGLDENDFYTAHCPERVLPGKILYELIHNDRIIGAQNEKAALMAKELYETFVKEGKCYTCDDITAEMCKLVENTFRDINIAYANQLAMICEEAHIDVFQLIRLANLHPRVQILNPGLGVGGHCLAVDPWFIVEKFKEKASLIHTARTINDEKPLWIKQQIIRDINENKNLTIGIIGLSYKPDIDDLRESPSLVLAEALRKDGYKVVGFEPNTDKEDINGIKILPLSDMKKCDYLVIALAHKELKDLEIKSVIATKPYYDAIGFMKG